MGLISVCLLFFGFVLLVIALGLVLPLLCGVILFYCLDLAVVHLLCVDWCLLLGVVFVFTLLGFFVGLHLLWFLTVYVWVGWFWLE